LLIAERTHAARLQIGGIDEAEEMHAAGIERIPAGALCVFAKAAEIGLAIVLVDEVVLAFPAASAASMPRSREDFGTPPLSVQTMPVPAQIIHSSAPRRSIPLFALSSDIIGSPKVADSGGIAKA
jgi:hypothetical protein